MYSQDALQRALQERQAPQGPPQMGGMEGLPPELMQMLQGGGQQSAMSPVMPIGGQQPMDPMQLIQMLMQQQGQ